jgi:hypothetical protein
MFKTIIFKTYNQIHFLQLYKINYSLE